MSQLQTLEELIKSVRSKLSEAGLYRKQGDVEQEKEKAKQLSPVKLNEKAKQFFEQAVGKVESALQEIKGSSLYKLDSALSGASLPDDQHSILLELIECYGVKGGLLRRLERVEEAIKSYEEGANLEEKFEEKFAVSKTYNRLNVVKNLLLSGKASLSSLYSKLTSLEKTLSSQLDKDQALAATAWPWADLGDSRALLGNWKGAEQAYRNFIRKSDTRSPETTIAVLYQVAQKLAENKDPSADKIHCMAELLKDNLSSRSG